MASSTATKVSIWDRCEVFQTSRNIQNNGYSNVASFHERGNRNKIVHTFFRS